jgi:hypothetical protein
LEIIIITQNEDILNEYKQKLEKEPFEISYYTFEQFKKDFNGFNQKINLLKSYDNFFFDEKIEKHYICKHLGNKFEIKNK